MVVSKVRNLKKKRITDAFVDSYGKHDRSNIGFFLELMKCYFHGLTVVGVGSGDWN